MAEPEAPLARRAFAELVGTALLLVAVVGSGIAATRLNPGEPGLQLLVNALATAGGLAAAIVAVGAVSGAHLNPAVTIIDRFLGNTDTRSALAYIAAQVAGAVIGVVLANLSFGLAAVEVSNRSRDGGELALAEVMATVGLLLVVVGVARNRRPSIAPFVVAAYIGGAYFFMSSTSFANPAVTAARTLTDTFTGIDPASAPMFIGAQLVGAGVALVLLRALYGSSVPNEATNDVPEVLFVCVHNAGRSQIAAALLDRHAAGRVRVRSAGSAPASELNPAVVEALAEIGLDVTKEIPKLLTDEGVRAADVVITMGCGDACPVYPGKRYLDWDLDDPAGRTLDEVRPIRDEIDRRARALVSELVPSA